MNLILCDDQLLSPHFWLHEFLRSEKAEALGIDNTPPSPIVEALRATAGHMEAVREALGAKTIHINSGYRCDALNRAVGSKSTSDHCKGWAVDFVCEGYGNPEDICHRLVSSDIPFKQLIFEHTWVHISFDRLAELRGDRPKREVLTLMAGGTYSVGIIEKAVSKP